VWWSHRRDQGAPDAATAVSQQKIRPAAMNRGESGGLTGAEDGGDLTMSTPTLGSVLLATTNEVALRDWYVKAFGVAPNADGFLDYGGVSVLIDRRDDVADRSAEPERVILNFHVDDARAVAAHLDSVGVTWVVPVEFRGDAWFATLHDPDGNLIQIIELTPSYWATRGGLLAGSSVASRLPAQDLDRARRWYADKLGLEPVEERQGGLRYECGGVSFALFESAGKPSGAHTQMGWEVADIDATVTELRARGVLFEEYDLPGLQTVDGIADIEGNYPSKGTGERAVWFHDSEGNLIGLGQPVRATN
jgi:catechol 2,3-dioxygenase-like lactoylglutathione lyase family enzyme